MTNHSYDHGQVQEWVDEVETALNLGHEFWNDDEELAELYVEIERHYDAAMELMEDGNAPVEDIYYELEVAYDLLDSHETVDVLNKALHMDYDEYVGDGL